MKKICAFLCAVLLLCTLLPVSAIAETTEEPVKMLVNSSCYIYQTPSTKTAGRAGYVTFGQELDVLTLGAEWAEISYEGEIRHILRKNLRYKTSTVVKNRVLVSPGAFACSVEKALGYAFYGSQVSVLGYETSRKGVVYLHCIVPQVYSADGTQLLATNVEGYINTAYLTETATPKIVNAETSLYACAFGASAAEELKRPVGRITIGEEVSALLSNGTWTKIRYQGKEYFVYSGKLDPKVVYVTVRRAAQTADARPGSGIRHYVYWNTPLTVLNTYQSDNFGTYYYCNVSGDYGFVREYSSAGQQYAGHNLQMQTVIRANLYALASKSAKVLSVVPEDTAVTVLYRSGNWAKVQIGGRIGYLSLDTLQFPLYQARGSYYTTAFRLYKGTASGTVNETVKLLAQNTTHGYVYVETETGRQFWMKRSSLTEVKKSAVQYVKETWINLHTQPTNDSPEFLLPYMTQVELLDGKVTAAGGWTRLRYQDQTYYTWIPAGENPFADAQSSFTYSCQTPLQRAAVDLAMNICENWPTKYTHGQSDGVADSDGYYGFDCSGFASYVINTAMGQQVPTYRVSANLQTLLATTGIYNAGLPGEFAAKTVEKSQLQAADVLFFDIDGDGETDHCGLYLGNGEFVHSSSSWDGDVCVMPLTGIYAQSLTCAKRYLPDSVQAAETRMTVTGGAVKLYAQKADTATVLEMLPKGGSVCVLFTDNGNWTYVRTDSGRTGYVLRKYLA